MLVKSKYIRRYEVVRNGGTPCNAPVHDHGEQQAEITVHRAKKGLKHRAATSDMPTKHLIATTAAGLNFETRSKLNCQINSFGEMARLSRQKANRHPLNPTSLEQLVIPPAYLKTHSGENLLLWDLLLWDYEPPQILPPRHRK